MSPFPRNLAASLLASAWTSLVQLLAVPLLLHLVGVAAYALVGLYASLIALLAILDLGLSTALARRMAALRAGADAGRAAALLRTYETAFYAGGVLIGGAIALAAPVIARGWLSSSGLAESELRDCVRLMGLLTALRWPSAPYLATLHGLQRQVGMSAVNAGAVTLANLGGAAVLWLVTPSILVFFAWQCACAALQLVALRALALRALPAGSGAATFCGGLLLDGWRFAAGLTAIAITGAILGQGDKIILSKLVTLEEYGYYAVALVLAGALQVIMLPVFNASLPRLCERVAAGDEEGLRRAFVAGERLMNALVVPVSVFLILFAHELLLLWTRDAQVAARAAPLVALLAVGTQLNAFMNLPYALQLARANTRLPIAINLALCALMVPAILILTERHGIAGGAAVSPLLNALYLLVGLPATYRICLGRAPWGRFYYDLARQQGAAILVLMAARLILPPGPLAAQAAVLAVALAASLTLSLLMTPEAREAMQALAGRKRPA